MAIGRRSRRYLDLTGPGREQPGLSLSTKWRTRGLRMLPQHKEQNDRHPPRVGCCCSDLEPKRGGDHRPASQLSRPPSRPNRAARDGVVTTRPVATTSGIRALPCVPGDR
jgi:hypothetical protein